MQERNEIFRLFSLYETTEHNNPRIMDCFTQWELEFLISHAYRDLHRIEKDDELSSGENKLFEKLARFIRTEKLGY